MTGIYAITNRTTGRHYIGSSNDVERRLGQHRHDLRTGRHGNVRLQSSWNMHGENAFEFEVIEAVSVEHLLRREQVYLDAFFSDLYNLSPIAGKPPSGMRKGAVFSDQHRERLRLANRNSGRRLSESTRAKMSASRMGRQPTAGMTGKRHTAEARATMGANRLIVGNQYGTRPKCV